MAVNNHILANRYQDPAKPPKGSLKFGVFANDGANPVENATIEILNNQTAETVTLESLKTDSSGKTLDIELSTPDIEYSLTPQGEVKPYSEYSAIISAPGYESVEIKGIELFQNTLAIQNVNLGVQNISAAKISSPPANEIIIGEHTLWAEYPPKIPESDVKELGPGTGFVVLDRPVIPQTIVVHDGPPDSDAKNYYVPYKDYIKNVASSEIYATWPDTTIRANILAIISFTLNRVYTEWYRNKGKNFSISSSTAFDHKFIYGRNIFENISQIVDEMFSTFITKEGIRQPLFTQYCDGRMVSCPNWMTQWGSKDLGDQGYSAVNILKNFYGYDIYLEQATQVQGIPSSFSGTDLQVGSTGNDVRTIQTQLNRIGDNFPAIPKVAVDGVYGQSTRKAVEAFQEIFNLPPSGIVDYPTWYKISDIYVGVTKMAG